MADDHGGHAADNAYMIRRPDAAVLPPSPL